MKKILYKKKVWTVLCPESLVFPERVIRNVLIEQDGRRVITNLKEIKEFKNTQLTKWL